MVEWAVHGLSRPWSPWIVHIFSRLVFLTLGLRHRAEGPRLVGPGVIVTNHASWLDILVLNAVTPVTFVSKAEVARWPGIGFLARIAGTIFITRDARHAGQHRDLLECYLRAGHRLAFFPEGTSTDGIRVLPFKSTLFAALFMPDLPALSVQPATILYRAPEGEDGRFYGWWGDMDFGVHALKLLAQRLQGEVRVILHPPVKVADFADRKALAAASGGAVRQGMETALEDR
nr:lysophospholipid acyltransferase family protein [Pseudoruegeria sp. HB172150]